MNNGISNPSEYRRKRQRISRACDQCRSKKVRCDEGQPACRRCVATKAKCTTTDQWGRSAPPETRRRSQKTGSITHDSTTNQTPRHDSHWTSNNCSDGATPRPYRNVTPGDALDATPQAGAPAETVNAESPPSFEIEQAVAVLVDDTSTRQQYMGSSSLQSMAQWLDLTFAIYGGNPSFSSGFRHGMRHAVEVDLPFSTYIPDLPLVDTMKSALDMYFARSNTIFVVCDEGDFRTRAAYLARKSDFTRLDESHRPFLASLYAILSIGIDEVAMAVTEEGTRYLQAAYSLLPHLLSRPYVSSLQALLLITIALMSRNKEGAGYQILGSAVRMAQSLGLHRQKQNSSQPGTMPGAFANRLWWIVYCLDKKFCFETGRPSMIADEDIDLPNPQLRTTGINVLGALVGLAKVQCQVSTRLYRGPRARGMIDDVFGTIVDIDKQLTQWLENVSEDIRPARDTIHFSPECSYVAIYLSFNYYQVAITLHRPALLFDDQIFQRQLDKAASHGKVYPRLRAGESICVSSARSIVTILNDAMQQNIYTRLFLITQPLLAVYCLAINVIKHPWSWSVPSDLKLMESTSKLIKQMDEKSGQDPLFSAMLQDLGDMANQIVSHANESAAKEGGQNEAVRSHSVPGFSDLDPYADDGFSAFINQDLGLNGTAEEIGNLFGLQFIGDAFDFTQALPP